MFVTLLTRDLYVSASVLKKKESEKTLHELHNINEQKYADRHIWSGDIFQEHFWTSISKKGTNVTILY